MSIVYLVRHGQASAGAADYDQLSTIGEQQSRLLGQWWKAHGFQPDTVYHGTLKRQRDTASLALHSLENALPEDAVQSNLVTGASAIIPQSHAGLNEYDHRVVETHFATPDDGKPEAMTFDSYVNVMGRWRDHDPDKPIPGGSAKIDASGEADSAGFETYAQFMQRGWSTIHAICSERARAGQTGDCVFFTSGGVIASILASILKLDFHHTMDAIWRIRNSSITTLHFNGGNARLIEFNTIPHLQVRPNPSLITLI